MSGAPGYTNYWSNSSSGSDASASSQTPNGTSDYVTSGGAVNPAHSALAAQANYDNGTDSSTSSESGSVINTSANPVTSNSGPVDASGGTGSYPLALQNVQTQGLNDSVVSAGEFALGSLTNLLRIGAQGNVAAASAPANQGNAAPGFSISPVLLIGAAVLLFLLLRK